MVLKERIDFCAELLDLSKAYIESYYASADNLHVSHRFENPATYVFYDSKEDLETWKRPQKHYHYIEVDPSMILDEYHFILCCDRMDGSQNESIEFFNSPYPIIMLKENGTQNIVGIMKPSDGETYNISDARELSYRKYSTVLTNFKSEMLSAMFSKNIFHYYPFLSNLTGGCALPEDEKE